MKNQWLKGLPVVAAICAVASFQAGREPSAPQGTFVTPAAEAPRTPARHKPDSSLQALAFSVPVKISKAAIYHFP